MIKLFFNSIHWELNSKQNMKSLFVLLRHELTAQEMLIKPFQSFISLNWWPSRRLQVLLSRGLQ